MAFNYFLYNIFDFNKKNTNVIGAKTPIPQNCLKIIDEEMGLTNNDLISSKETIINKTPTCVNNNLISSNKTIINETQIPFVKNLLLNKTTTSPFVLVKIIDEEMGLNNNMNINSKNILLQII